MCSRVSQTFGVPEEAVTVVFKRSRKMLEALMDGTGNPKLFAAKNDAGEVDLFDVEENVGSARAVYFIRTAATVDMTKSNDGALLFGELDSNPLAGLETMLSHVYQPLLANDKVWGKADKGQSGEFRAEMSKFCVDLQGALKHLTGGVDLRKPDKQFDLDSNAAEQPKMLEHFEGLLEEWCTGIESCLSDDDADPANTKGLMDELEYWRRRMQSLTSITEQLKTREFKAVIGALSRKTSSFSSASVNKNTVGFRWWPALRYIVRKSSSSDAWL
eukprot:g6202.t1